MNRGVEYNDQHDVAIFSELVFDNKYFVSYLFVDIQQAISETNEKMITDQFVEENY